jgi:hypothetical protein
VQRDALPTVVASNSGGSDIKTAVMAREGFHENWFYIDISWKGSSRESKADHDSCIANSVPDDRRTSDYGNPNVSTDKYEFTGFILLML